MENGTLDSFKEIKHQKNKIISIIVGVLLFVSVSFFPVGILSDLNNDMRPALGI